MEFLETLVTVLQIFSAIIVMILVLLQDSKEDGNIITGSSNKGGTMGASRNTKLANLTKYVGMAKNIDPSAIQIATIPGAPSTKGVISYWIIEPEKTQELINKMVYRVKTNIDAKDLSIGILYAASRQDSAMALKDELEAKGAAVKMQTSDNVSKNYIAIHNLDIAGDVISELKKTIPEIKDKHTIIIIDKKADVLKMSDNVILLNEGEVVETGTYEDLSNNKLFKKIVED
jgi:hypothetical protein